MDVNSPVSLPPIFSLSKLTWFHYDNQTFTSAATAQHWRGSGMGAVADMQTGRSSEVAQPLRLEELAAWLLVPLARRIRWASF